MLTLELRHRTLDASDGALKNAVRSWKQRRSVLLELVRGGEVLGRGEVTPLPGYGPDTLERAVGGLKHFDVSCLEPLLSRASVDFEELAKLLAALSSSAKFALECALLDAVGNQTGQPVWQLLNPPGPTQLRPAMPPLDAPCQLLTLQDGLERAHELSGCVKFKIGAQVHAEIETIRSIVQRRPELSIRLDANRSLPLTNIGVILDELAELRPQFLEEPCPLGALGSPRQLPVGLALDESLQSGEDLDLARRWLESGHVEAVVLKSMAIGGLCAALEWWQFASKLGSKVVVSHCFDGTVAMAAYRHLARALAADSLEPGLGPHAGLGLWREFAGAEDLSKPGLGLRKEAAA